MVKESLLVIVSINKDANRGMEKSSQNGLVNVSTHFQVRGELIE